MRSAFTQMDLKEDCVQKYLKLTGDERNSSVRTTYDQ